MIQTYEVAAALRKSWTGIEIVVIQITSIGDKQQAVHPSESGVGMFIKELEESLAGRQIDVAVHSLKDVPVPLAEGFKIAVIPKRSRPEDILVSRTGMALDDLPPGARIGTGSARRKALLLSRRPDLDIIPVRGNVPTRLKKLKEGTTMDAVVLAYAGLDRLSLEKEVTEILSADSFVPAAGQGALALEIRADDEAVEVLCNPLNDPNSFAETTAERSFLNKLGAGCTTPTSAHAKAEAENGILRMIGFTADRLGKRLIRTECAGSLHQPVKLGERCAQNLIEKGALKLIHCQDAKSEA